MTFDEWFQSKQASKQGECYDSMYCFARDAWNFVLEQSKESYQEDYEDGKNAAYEEVRWR